MEDEVEEVTLGETSEKSLCRPTKKIKTQNKKIQQTGGKQTRTQEDHDEPPKRGKKGWVR